MIGTYLKDYMDKNGIKPVFIAEKTGICPQILGAMLNGQKKIEIVEYYDICAAMGTNPIEIALASGCYAVTENSR